MADKSNDKSFDALRRRAEETLAKTREAIATMPVEDVQQLVHELQVHQIELDMQNEELRNTQIELEAAKDNYCDLYDFAPVGYLTLDRMGVILEANLTAATLLKIERSNLINRKLSIFTVTSDQDILRQHLDRVFSERTRQVCEFQITNTDQMLIHVRLESVLAEDESGMQSRCRTAMIDISQRKRAEERLLHQIEVTQVSRLSILNELAHQLANKLRQPLTAIQTYASACMRNIQANNPSTESLQHDLGLIAPQVGRAVNIIQQMRNFAQRKAHYKEPASINIIVSEAVDLMKTETEMHNISIQQELADNIPWINIDGVLIEHVILNLIYNSIEAMVQHNSPIRNIAIQTAMSDKETIEITVSDTGPGVPQKIANELFEPFVTTKPDGVGMGLAISRSAVADHGGRLWMMDNSEEGASFRFTLPTRFNLE
ncbi:MAG: sensor histidine kinase [Planctomycetota bacterium]|jgi:PAS domain S-box-containing protein